MKVATVVGARPQFIKAAVVSKQLQDRCQEIIVHTGQHYDVEMSGIFFEQLKIPKPKYNLGVGSESHGKQTGAMLAGIEDILLEEKPDAVIVFGDTNSTLAGALAGAKLHIPIAHIEAGIRSFNKKMPEELNRILTDHVSKYLFCPTQTGVVNLKNENIVEGVYNVGDVMYDSALTFLKIAENDGEASKIFEELEVKPKEYRLATLHRAETVEGGEERLRDVLGAFEELDALTLFPAHPRIKRLVENVINKYEFNKIKLIQPVGYLQMLLLTANAKQVLTDSGGLQKEAWFFNTPCVTLRTETEWVETLEGGWNVLSSFEKSDIIMKAQSSQNLTAKKTAPFGDGAASKRIADILCG